MLTDGLRREVREAGFGVSRALISKTAAASYLEALNDLTKLQAAGKLQFSDKGLIHSPMFIRNEFMSLLDSEALCSVVDEILDRNAILYAFSTSTVAPKDTNYAGSIHVDSPRVIPGYITNLGFIIALTEFTAENGATQMLPYSFERTEPPTESEFSNNAVAVLMKPGDAIVFNCRSWHRSTPNRTDTWRASITLNFCRSYMRQRFDYPRMISKSDALMLSSRQRRLLGFNVQMPISYDEFSAPMELRKYKPNQG